MPRTAKSTLDTAAGTQQADSNGRLRPSMLPRNFLYFIALDIMPLKNDTIIGLAIMQDPFDVYCSHVHPWRRLQLWQRLSLRFTS